MFGCVRINGATGITTLIMKLAGAILAHVSYLLLKQSISRHFCLCLADQESPSFSCGLCDTCQCPEWGDSLERLELNSFVLVGLITLTTAGFILTITASLIKVQQT